MTTALLVYMPVLHQGYLDFLERYPDAHVYLVGRSITDEFDHLKRKDIRAIDPYVMQDVIRAVCGRVGVMVCTLADLPNIAQTYDKIVFADEEESREIASKYFRDRVVEFSRVFLRWDKGKVLEQHEPEAFPVTSDDMHRKLMAEAENLADRSPDWWRQIGALLVAGDKKIVAYNKHVPSDRITYELGDARSFFKKGIGIELTSACHSEAAVIGRAAQEGVSTQGASLYVSTFPCPFCANVLTTTGIKELYFRDGYSILDAAHSLLAAGIAIFRVV